MTVGGGSGGGAAGGDPPPPRPELAALQIADPPGAWSALGFTVDDGIVTVGAVEMWLDAAGRGITGWTLRHAPAARDDIDGLATGVTLSPPAPSGPHRNGAIGVDQVVITSREFDRTAAALARAGMPLRRTVDHGAFRQGFRRLGPAILELVEVPDGPPGPARFWGLVVIVADLEMLREQLAGLLSDVRDAVQPGRHITALLPAAGLTPQVAFMDRDPRSPA